MAQTSHVGYTNTMAIVDQRLSSIFQVQYITIMIVLLLYIILLDVPYLKNSLITYQEKETYFTTVLELGDMFDGGGVPIDYYIIKVGTNTQLETPGPTYSVDVMYNETLTVNISAHNCAGYSDVIVLTVEYDRGK